VAANLTEKEQSDEANCGGIFRQEVKYIPTSLLFLKEVIV
jgi:hypothetical protein